MGFFLGLAVIVIVCVVAVFVLPQPPYGCPRGCAGGALQRAMDEEKEREEKKKAAG
ncbi:MAG: hypothetical protein DELT_00594 [Desulfovibrio sp.]